MSAIKEMILSFDKSGLFFFQHLQRPWMDYFLAWPTYLGGTFQTLTLLTVGVLVFDKKKGLEKLSVALTGTLLTYWVSQWLKIFFHRPRPHILWPEIHVIFEKPLNDAFPSGHTAIIFTAAFLLNYLYPGKTRWTYAVAVWVAITRVYVGAHYPTDLIGGVITAFVCASLTWRVLKMPGTTALQKEI